jgi:hypothetical protein
MGEVPLDELAAAVRHLRLTDGADTGSIPSRDEPSTGPGHAEIIQPQTPMGTRIAAESHNGIRNNAERDSAPTPAEKVYAAIRDAGQTPTGDQLHRSNPPTTIRHGEGGIRTPEPNPPDKPS